MEESKSRRVRRVHVFVGAPVVNPDCSDTRENVTQSSRPHAGFQELPCTWQESRGQLLLKSSDGSSGIRTCASNAGSDVSEQTVDHDGEDESDPSVMDGSQELFDLQPSLQEYIESTFPEPCDDTSLGSKTAADHRKWFTRPAARTSQDPGCFVSASCADDYSEVMFPSLLTQQPLAEASSVSDRLSPPPLGKPSKDPESGGAGCAEHRRGHPSSGPDAAELTQTSSGFGHEELTFEAFGSGVLCSQVVPPTPVAVAERGGKAARLKQHVVRKRKWELEVKGCSKSRRVENNRLASCENEKYASLILSGNVKCQVEALPPLTQSHSVVETEYAKRDAREITSENLPKRTLTPIETNEREFASRADGVADAVSEADPKPERRGDGETPAPIVSDLGRLLQQQKRAAQLRRDDPQMCAVDTTPLADCTGGGAKRRRNVMVAVLACLPVRDVQVKRGALSGRCVPVAGVVATDQSLASTKLVMWRLAAFWALLLAPGDVVVLTDVFPHTDTWMREEVLQLTPASRMLKLGLWPLVQPSHWREMVNERKLEALLRHLSEHHQHLGVVGPRAGLAHKSSVRYCDLHDSEPDSIIHCAGRVTAVVTRTEWDPYTNVRAVAGTGPQVCTVTLQQSSRVERSLRLTGQAASWAGRLRSAPPGSIWAFQYMVVRKDPVAMETELWSTPLSSCERLSPDDARAALCADLVPEGPIARHSSLTSLLAAHITGRVEVTARITSLRLLGGAGRAPRAGLPGRADAGRPSLRVDAATPLVAVATALPGLLLWGCAGCGREMRADDRGVLAPCLPCAPRAPCLFYPPAVLHVTDGLDGVDVRVSPRSLEKLLLNIPPGWLHRPAGCGSALTFCDLVADLCSALVRGTEPFRLLLASLCERDENDVLTRRSLSLLQLSLDLSLDPALDHALDAGRELIHATPAASSDLLQP